MLAMQVHAHLKVQSRCHINPEVVRLQHLTITKNWWIDLDQRIVVEKLVDVCLLLLAKGEWETSTRVATINYRRPSFVVLLLNLLLSQHDSHMRSWSN